MNRRFQRKIMLLAIGGTAFSLIGFGVGYGPVLGCQSANNADYEAFWGTAGNQTIQSFLNSVNPFPGGVDWNNIIWNPYTTLVQQSWTNAVDLGIPDDPTVR